MKKFTTVLLICILSTVVKGQIRISQVDEGGANVSNYVKSYQGTNYLIQHTQHDSLKVYEVLSSEEMVLLHSRNYVGLGEYDELTIQGSKVLLSAGGTPVVYDYVADADTRYELPDDWLVSSWSFSDSTSAYLNASNIINSTSTGFIINYQDDGIVEVNTDITVKALCGDIIFGSIQEETSDDVSYLAYNYRNAMVDTLGRFNDDSAKPYYDGRYIYYFDNKKLQRYDTNTRQLENLHYVTASPGLDPSIYTVGSTLYIQPFRAGSQTLEQYDMLMQMMTDSVDIGSERFYNYKVYGNILTATGSSAVLFYDMDTGNFTTVEVRVGEMPDGLVEERYFLTGQSGEITIVDTETMEVTVSDFPALYRFEPHVNYIDTGDKYILSLVSSDVREAIVYEIDTESGLTLMASTLGNTTAGLELINTNIYRLENGVGVGSKIILGVDDDGVARKQNERALENSIITGYYRYKDEKLYYVSRDVDLDQYDIWSYDGSHNKLETSLSLSSVADTPSLQSYIVTDEYVLYVKETTDRVLERKNIQTGEVEVLLPQLSATAPISPILFSNRDDVYLLAEELYHISSTGEVTEMEVQLPLFPQVYAELYTIGKRTILRANRSLFDLNGSEVQELHSNLTIFNTLEVDDQDEILYFNDNNTMWIHTESENYSFTFDGTIVSRRYDNGSFLLGVDPGTNITQVYKLDVESGLITELPDLGEEEYIRGWTTFAGNEYVITRRGSLHYGSMTIYKYLEDAEAYESCYSVVGQGVPSWSDVLPISDTLALLYAGGVVGLLSADSGVRRFEGIKGETWQKGFVQVGDQVYFIANSPQYGSQLYSYDIQAGGVSVVDQLGETEELLVYPNPTTDFLTITSATDRVGSVEIYALSGQLVYAGSKVSGIPVRHLAEGTYVVTATYSDGSVRSAAFVKQ